MRNRLIALAVLAVIGLTAFAPAPLIRNERKRDRDGDVIDALQGTWSVTEKVRMGPNGTLMKYSTAQKVCVEGEAWRFTSAAALKGKGVAKGAVSYKIVADPKRRPAEFRVKRAIGGGDATTDYMVGIVRVTGSTAKMLYRLGTGGPGSKDEMPRDFDTIPEGWYSMTLSRDP